MVSFSSRYEQAWREQPAQRDRLAASVLYELAREVCEGSGLAADLLDNSRLSFASDLLDPVLARGLMDWAGSAGAGSSRCSYQTGTDRLDAAHCLGQALDRLLALEAAIERDQLHSLRSKSGSFFTPPRVARAVVERAAPFVPKLTEVMVCDLAVGGGAFLLEAARVLVEREQQRGVGLLEARQRIWSGLHGMDRMPVAVAVAEVALWLYCTPGGMPALPNPRLLVGDSLSVNSWNDAPAGGFDWIVGNPPWVSFQGRAARPLAPETRRYYRGRFTSFRGFPTLHGLFTERAAELAPQGLLTLLLPSSLSDLDGYRAARSRLTASHRPLEPLQEYGQDAFADVVQPCFALIAAPRLEAALGKPEKWQLDERARHTSATAVAAVPASLTAIAQMPPLPAATFRELGFQTNRQVTEKLLLRASAPRGHHQLGLLEGKRVREFVCFQPELFLHVDRQLLESTKCTLRPPSAYESVDFVIRQTAAYPIAAAHNGHVFRNSLIGGFAAPDLDCDLLLGLLNSSLYRALHVAGQRDARQAAFPQVKLSHLRKLPYPPDDAVRRERVRRASQLATSQSGASVGLRRELDQAVFDLFRIDDQAREQISKYLCDRNPGAVTSRSTKARE